MSGFNAKGFTLHYSVTADTLIPKISPFCSVLFCWASESVLESISNDYTLDKKKYTNRSSNLPVACKHVFLRFLVYVCGFCGSEAAHCISLWDRVRSGEEGRLEGLEGAGDVGGMSLGGKL